MKKKLMDRVGLTENTIYNFFENINYKKVLTVVSEVVFVPK